MNGGVNGTMQEPTDTSLLTSPVDLKTVTTKESGPVENHCENSSNTENSTHLDSELSLGLISNSIQEDSAHSHSNDSGNRLDNKEATKSPNKVSTQELSNNSTNFNCSNSNESYPEATTGQQAKLATDEQPVADVKSKNDDSEMNYNNTMKEIEDVDSEDESSYDEGSVMSIGPKAEDAVSINSDSEPENVDDSSQESQTKIKDADIIIIDNDNRLESQNGNSHGSASLDVHEIPSDNDDCISVNDNKSSVSGDKIQLRRSGRAIKRKRYEEEFENEEFESDIEEVETEDPLFYKTKPIVINDAKDLVEMTSKQMKTNQNNQRKETTVVIIDSKSGKGPIPKKSAFPTTTNISTQNLYQSMVARGTTVTPVRNNTTSNTPSSAQVTQTSILPSLTDDMFVVEAPSFIVPYVYEKPSVKPFREFVDILGKELDEQKAKEEKERLEKEKALKEKREMEKKEKKDRGEEVSESEPDVEKADKTDENEEEKKKKKAEKRERRKRRDDDDASWDGESSSETEDETLSDDDTVVVIKNKADSIEEIKDVTDLTTDKISSGKSDNYFDCSLGNFFINIGLNMVQEYVQTDLLKQQNRKLYREKKSGHNTRATESSIAALKKNLEFSKENNAPYSLPQKKCDFCSFKTESTLVMNNHLETPHMKNNLYKCNFCEFEIRSPHDILFHMEAEHNSRGKLERAPSCHQCPNCPFEDNGKGKLARHLIACAKKYKPELNLAPPLEWEPPAKIPKITRARNNMVGSYQNVFNRQVANNMGRPMNIGNLMPGSGVFRARGRSPLAAPARTAPVLGVPIVRSGVMIRHSTPAVPSTYSAANNGKLKSTHQPSISITPLPRQAAPVPQAAQQTKSSTFVICEICDGYIKDLEQLRNHMQWIHKVKIHPKMIYNRPPLNCQKCQFRFFTDQGLERHLLGSHGLVTSSMQEAANKGKDAGRCPVCGRVYQWKLLNHVAKDHNLTLKPAHLSYKCTVCTATFGMYKQFENHVYSAHSVVAKRVMDKSKVPAKPGSDSLLKPLKINDEITIIPQPAKAATSSKNK